ncbi:MAG: hypothetical protein H7239_04445 [Flavobacterium sp.]|nr:hypothetical protein [Flavobacterium sp.]
MRREEQRYARESAKRYKEQQKLNEIQAAYGAVESWKSRVLYLKTIHLKSSIEVDWNKIKNIEKPVQPKSEFKNEDFAKNTLENFKPTFLDKLFGLIPKKIKNLKELLEQAKIKDKNENDANFKKYLDNFNDWEKLQEISIGVAKKQIEFYEKALEYFNPFSKIGEIGDQIDIFLNDDFVDIHLAVNSLDVIPDYELKQTSTGKLSKTNISRTRFNELYQQHVCSCILRVGREIFALLPYKYSRINATTKIVNCKNGNIEENMILSVIFSIDIMQKINFGLSEPLDNINNFTNNVSFNKINGFNLVNKVEFNKR